MQVDKSGEGDQTVTVNHGVIGIECVERHEDAVLDSKISAGFAQQADTLHALVPHDRSPHTSYNTAIRTETPLRT